ncbi:MAG: putative quinol monooxygenase [Planctomycetaceae bacterium]
MFCLNVILTINDGTDPAVIRARLAEAARLSRQEQGCLRFEVYHSRADENLFLLCEHWESEAAWQTHRGERAVQEIYLPQVLPHVDRAAHPSTLVE